MSGTDQARMTIGLMPAGVARMFGDLRSIVTLAQIVEDAGLDEFLLGDHVVMGDRLDRYPYGAFGYGPDLPPIASDEPWLEVMTTLSVIAGATSRIRLVPGVLLVPLRPAVLLAKTAATLDVLSGGRLELGVGVGWQRVEYDALGVPYADRWQRTDDTIAACRALWRDLPATFDSSTVSFGDVFCAPLPRQSRIPISIGAKATAATARRVAQLGDGWFPLTRDPDEIRVGAERMRDAWVAAGREPAVLGVRAQGAIRRGRDGRLEVPRMIDEVRAYRAAGATAIWYALSPGLRLRDLEEARALVGELADVITPACTGADGTSDHLNGSND
jgi:probable F420-dependent oxidoreductase